MEFDSFFKREGKAKKLYPVIHVRNLAQAQLNAHAAFQNGAYGIFLINHTISSNELLRIAFTVRLEWPNRFIGVNLLDANAGDAFALASDSRNDLNAVWVDDSGIGDYVWSFAEHLHERMQRSSWLGYYFASVAFKGQSAPVIDLVLAAQNGSQHAHVVVTSCPRTGSPPSVEKIRTMKEAIPNHPLAIASGMTCKNIHDFLPYADIFMVATGISDKYDNFDLRLVHQMATIIQNYNKSAGLLQ